MAASVLGSLLCALGNRPRRERAAWWWVAPALALGLVLGWLVRRWAVAPPRLDDETVLGLIRSLVVSGATLAPAGLVPLVAAVLACTLTLRPVGRELRRPWARPHDRPAGIVRSVLAAELMRGRRLSSRLHRRLVGALVPLAALVAGCALALPWPLVPAAHVGVLTGAAATSGLLLAVSLVSSQGPLVHADTLRWLADAGLEPRRVVDRYLGECVRLILVPSGCVGAALAALTRWWWLAPVTVLVAVCLLLAGSWADLTDPTREQQSDGTAESGVVAGLVTALVGGLLVAPYTVLPVPLAVGLDLVATVAIAVHVRRRFLTEIAQPVVDPARGTCPARTSEGGAMDVVRTQRLSVGHRRGQEVLSGLELHVPAGLSHLRGANGAGKSTLVEVLAGGLTPWFGTVTLYEHDVWAARPLRRVCRSRPALYPTFTLREHLQLLADAGVVVLAEALERCDRYGVGEWLDVPSEQLSTGNLRKGWIVLSTTSAVPLWLMDEPFNGLDESGVEVLTAELAARTAAGRDVVLVAHQLPAGLTPTTVVELPARVSPTDLSTTDLSAAGRSTS